MEPGRLLRQIADTVSDTATAVWSIGAVVHQLNRKADRIVATIEEVRTAYREAFQTVKDQRDAAVQLAQENATRAQENADALARFQADDAATDATQLAAQAQEFANQFQSDLDSLKDQPTPDVEAIPEPDTTTGTVGPVDTGTPVEPAPVPDDVAGTPDDGSGAGVNVVPPVVSETPTDDTSGAGTTAETGAPGDTSSTGTSDTGSTPAGS